LHVLSTPPAFVLSQDQTLREGIYDFPGRAGFVDTESHRLGDGFNHWSYELGLSFARCTKGISFTFPTSRKCGRELFHGTNFRHAVEFSRSGRAPSQPFRTGRGQPDLHYSVGCARSNLTGSARFPLGRRTRLAVARRTWGTVRPAPPRFPPVSRAARGGSVRRTRRTLITRPGRVKSARHPSTGPYFREFPDCCSLGAGTAQRVWIL
jgi:hypothetical protein